MKLYVENEKVLRKMKIFCGKWKMDVENEKVMWIMKNLT